MPRARPVAQLALDEQFVEDHEVETALEERQQRREAYGAVRAAYQEAHDRAVGLIARLELPEGGAARVGRFRVTRSTVAARSVSFETSATSRLRISLADDDEEE